MKVLGQSSPKVLSNVLKLWLKYDTYQQPSMARSLGGTDPDPERFFAFVFVLNSKNVLLLLTSFRKVNKQTDKISGVGKFSGKTGF